jgi:hypothetical protein
MVQEVGHAKLRERVHTHAPLKKRGSRACAPRAPLLRLRLPAAYPMWCA